MKIEKCLCCESEVKQLMDWGQMPLANNYSVKEKFPLQVNKCTVCHHLQLSEAVDPEILFSDYPYFSGMPKTSTKYFADFAENTLRYYPDAKTAMDIACNDGAQLDAFKKLGIETFGVDPAKNLYDISSAKGHKVRVSLFEQTLFFNNKYDIITAQNVVAHTATPFEFMKKCKEIMHEGSYLFVATSQADMVKNNEYDTIYHEHISYFNTSSMKALVDRAGLTLVDVYKTPIHGTSYVFVIKLNKEVDPIAVEIQKETNIGLLENKTYDKWVENCAAGRKLKSEEIESYRSQGYEIIGCAAAAKGITFLNLTGTKLRCIVDTTPAKWFGNVCDTNIMPFEFLRSISSEKILFVILAWNFEAEIKENVLKFRNNENDIFITTKV